MTQRGLNRIKRQVRAELHPTRSYYGVVRIRAGRGYLLGGGVGHQSSRFTTREQAQRWVDVAVEINNGRLEYADAAYGEVCGSQHPPEIDADGMVYSHVAPSIVG
jgi:hypothetical protein